MRVVVAIGLLLLAGCAAPPVRSTPPRVAAAPPPLPDEAAAVLGELHRTYAGERGGKVADHNPVAAAADADDFGIAIAAVDGRVLSVGDAREVFPLQSLSKAFTFALALEENGDEEMLALVGTHATGLPYGSLAATEVRATKLQNPMVSAGAIATASTITGPGAARRMKANLDAFAGRELPTLDEVFEAVMESRTGSLAKAWVLASYGLLQDEPEATVRRYLRACATGVTAEDLAVMGATLANGGVNPRTGERVVSAAHARGVLSAMVTAGMYDDSGPWFYRTGLPAKSGVGGGVVAIVPGRFAIAVYSPPLDERGNSVRATKVVRDLAARWRLHAFESAGR